ncbi:hypothetical protein ACHAWO_004734 [Cyclotella atomus]|uniref:Cyclin N-terminal domain-containing protein n=1 Tax=Cyclotella atomus TaxID=382360 RepID=A0ABD3NZU3_9STRA
MAFARQLPSLPSLHFGLFMGSNSRSVELARADIGTAQLAFVTCLVIALKTHSGLNVESDFVSNTICRDMYGADEIIQMELEILQSLQWRLSGPLPHDFIDSFLQVVIPFVDSRHLNFLSTCSKALVERAVKRYDVALQYPSVIAFTSICCALPYLQVISPVESMTVLHYMKSVSGCNFEDPAAWRLYKTMVELMHEFLPGVSNGGAGGGPVMVDGRSVSSNESPRGIFYNG